MKKNILQIKKEAISKDLFSFIESNYKCIQLEKFEYIMIETQKPTLLAQSFLFTVYLTFLHAALSLGYSYIMILK